MESLLGNLNLSTEENDELVLHGSVLADETIRVGLCLVGRFLTDKPINFSLMRDRMASIWRPGKGVLIKEIGNGRYIFQFFHSIDLQRILQGGPWSFGNFPLLLHRLQEGEFPLRVPLNTINFWVQIFDLPMGFMTEGVGLQLGSFIGEFLEYDKNNSTSFWRAYMRLRVAIDVRNPLKRGKRIKNADGSTFFVNFRYERLHIFCFICGLLDHSESFCEKKFGDNPDSEIKREWGTWLKASDRRGLSLASNKWLRTEEDGLDDATGEDGGPINDGSRRGKGIFEFQSPHQSPQLYIRDFSGVPQQDVGDHSHSQKDLPLSYAGVDDTSSLVRDVRSSTPGKDRKRRRVNNYITDDSKTLTGVDNSIGTSTNSIKLHSSDFLLAGSSSRVCREQ